MRKKCPNICPIYEEAVGHIWLCYCSILDFLIYEENLIFFFISVWLRSCSSKITERNFSSWSQITYFLLGTAGLRKYTCSPWWIDFRRCWPIFKGTVARDEKVLLLLLICHRWPRLYDITHFSSPPLVLRIFLNCATKMQLKSVRN